jgi:hypothetical protein
MSVDVRVAGRLLGTIAPVTGVEWTTRWSYDEISGPAVGQFRLSAPGFAAGWFKAGAAAQIVDQGKLRMGGRLSEPEEVDGGIQCYIRGYGTLGDSFDAYEDTDPLSPRVYMPTTVPNTAVDQAIVRGLPWVRPATLGSTALGVDDGVVEKVSTIVLRAAKLAGKRAVVDSAGVVSLVSDPSSPMWLLGGMSNYMGTADDEFITRLFGYYVSGVGGSGAPNAWATVFAEDPAAATKFGQEREATVDLTALGLLTSGAAQGHIDGRFALVGGRMGWTQPFTVGRGLRLASGELADPAALVAGDMVAMPGVRDTRSQVTSWAMRRLIVGEARHVVDDGLTYCKPLGLLPRGYSTALAAAQAPVVQEVA